MADRLKSVLASAIRSIGTESYVYDASEQHAEDVLYELDAAGFVIVPKEATEKMLKVAHDTWFDVAKHSVPAMTHPLFAKVMARHD